jgi:hypothetical protein
MRFASTAFVLTLCILGAGCQSGGEVIPPRASVGPGVPADLPALGQDEFAVVRLVING